MTKYDLTLTQAVGQTDERVCTIERSYPKVYVGQMLKPYHEYLAINPCPAEPGYALPLQTV